MLRALCGGCFAFIPHNAYNTFAVDLKAAEVYASMLMDSKPIREGCAGPEVLYGKLMERPEARERTG